MAVSIRIGSRKSTMALAQTEEIVRGLSAVAPGLNVEIVKFETAGDTDQTSKLLKHDDEGGAFSPITGYSTIDGRDMALPASVLDEAGGRVAEIRRIGGRAMGPELLDRGAA